MTVFQAVILGVVQGVTEFLPISSTAHLVIVPDLLGWNLDPELRFVFDVLVQLGSTVAVIGYFRHDLWKLICAVTIGLRKGSLTGSPHARLGWLISIATIPAVISGLFLKELISQNIMLGLEEMGQLQSLQFFKRIYQRNLLKLVLLEMLHRKKY